MTGWSCECGATGLGGVRCVHCGRYAWWYAAPEPRVPGRHRRDLPGRREPRDPRPPKAELDSRGRAIAVLILLVLTIGFVRIEMVVRWEEQQLAAAFDAAVRELALFVEQERGAPFRDPVAAELLDDEEFLDLFGGSPASGSSGGGASPTGFTATMYALGLADAYDDVDALAAQGFDSSVVGSYVEENRTLYVRGDAVTPYTRLVIVHELTHAWQDQHYGLAALRESAAGGDGYEAVTALIEGDASRVEEVWRARQTAADRATIERVENDRDRDRELARAERSIGLLGSFRYVVGLEFAEALHAHGGNAAVDRAFRDPPTSTEQILHPERYLRQHAPVSVTTPSGVTTVLDEGVLGELGLLLLLGRGDEPDDAAFAAADGWGGDAYVTWDDEEHLCTMVVIAADSRAHRAQLVAALRARERPPAVSLRADGMVDATFCVLSRA